MISEQSVEDTFSFSLFRGSALLGSRVMETYKSIAESATDHLQFDQGIKK